jgi:hypothetical protein
LAENFNLMLRNLRRVTEEDKRQNRLKSGAAQLNDVMSGEKRPGALSRGVPFWRVISMRGSAQFTCWIITTNSGWKGVTPLKRVKSPPLFLKSGKGSSDRPQWIKSPC